MRKNLILLAAGFSRRFGGEKLLAAIDGTPLYQIAIDKLYKLCLKRPDCHLYVVASNEEILFYCKKNAIVTIENKSNENTGIASSIQKAVRYLEEKEAEMAEPACDVFFTADQPLLDIGEVDAFFQAYDASGKPFGTISCKGIWRNPNIFPSSSREELLALQADQGGKYVLKRHAEEVFCYRTENESQFYDIDTREDFRKLSQGIISSKIS